MTTTMIYVGCCSAKQNTTTHRSPSKIGRSSKETQGWKADARKRIKRSNVVIVVCGDNTHQAVGVTAEIKIARDEGVSLWLLRGRKNGTCRRPQGTSWPFNPIHEWTWDNIEAMCRYVMLP